MLLVLCENVTGKTAPATREYFHFKRIFLPSKGLRLLAAVVYRAAQFSGILVRAKRISSVIHGVFPRWKGEMRVLCFRKERFLSHSTCNSRFFKRLHDGGGVLSHYTLKNGKEKKENEREKFIILVLNP